MTKSNNKKRVKKGFIKIHNYSDFREALYELIMSQSNSTLISRAIAWKVGVFMKVLEDTVLSEELRWYSPQPPKVTKKRR